MIIPIDGPLVFCVLTEELRIAILIIVVGAILDWHPIRIKTVVFWIKQKVAQTVQQPTICIDG